MVWVAIRFGVTSLDIISSFAQEFVDPLRNVLGSLCTIFAHFDECRPNPGSKESKKYQLPGQKLAVLIDKRVEIRELRAQRITDAFHAIERDAAHRGKAGDGGCFHVNQRRLVGGGESPFFGVVGDARAGGEP